MKIALFGGTGDLGTEILHRGLEQGHLIEAFVRSPEKIDLQHERLKITRADVMKDSTESLREGIAGNDLVISALGTGMSPKITKLYSEGTAKIIASMQQAQVNRLIAISSCGTDPSPDDPWWYLLLVRRILINVYIDMTRMEERIVNTPDLKWTIVRPTRLTNNKSKAYRVGLNYGPEKGSEISRADVAEFILEQIDKNAYLYKFPALAY